MTSREVSVAFDKAVASYRAFVIVEADSSQEKRRQPVSQPPQQETIAPVVVVGTVVGMWDAATGNAVFI